MTNDAPSHAPSASIAIAIPTIDHLIDLADAIRSDRDNLLDDLHDDPTNDMHPPRIERLTSMLDAILPLLPESFR